MGVQKRHAKHMFKLLNNGFYTATVTNVTRFKLASDFMATGMLFYKIGRAYIDLQEGTSPTKLHGLGDNMVGGFLHTLAAFDL